MNRHFYLKKTRSIFLDQQYYFILFCFVLIFSIHDYCLMIKYMFNGLLISRKSAFGMQLHLLNLAPYSLLLNFLYSSILSSSCHPKYNLQGNISFFSSISRLSRDFRVLNLGFFFLTSSTSSNLFLNLPCRWILPISGIGPDLISTEDFCFSLPWLSI